MLATTTQTFGVSAGSSTGPLRGENRRSGKPLIVCESTGEFLTRHLGVMFTGLLFGRGCRSPKETAASAEYRDEQSMRKLALEAFSGNLLISAGEEWTGRPPDLTIYSAAACISGRIFQGRFLCGESALSFSRLDLNPI